MAPVVMRFLPMCRAVAVLVGLGVLMCSIGADGRAQQRIAPVSGAGSAPRALVNRYCVSCHSERVKSGGLALDTADVDHLDQNAVVWEKVVRKIRARAMPPPGPGRPRPDDASYDAF